MAEGRYYLETYEPDESGEDGRTCIGRDTGYRTLAEAVQEAMKFVDDACPRLLIYVVQRVGHAFLRGDGEAGWSGDEEAAQGKPEALAGKHAATGTTPRRPMRPEEAAVMKAALLPDEVIAVFDSLIAQHYDGHSATVRQDEAAAKVAAVMGVTREQVFKNKWMDIEELYRAAGWEVEYDKPGFNESYHTTFTFSKRRGRRGDE